MMSTMSSVGEPDFDDMNQEQALESLFRTHYRTLVGIASLIIDDASAGEDVVQDAFASLYRSWERIEDRSAAPAYLRRTVVNLCRSRIRRRITARRYRPQPPPDGESAEEVMLRQSDWSPVVAAVRSLPRRQRECLSLRYLADLSEAEIAIALGISRGSVKAYTHRGLAALATLIGEVP